jgi:hypothetical protein
MQIPETPANIEHVQLMERLKSYADGRATWHQDKTELGPEANRACLTLYDNLVQLVNKVFAPLLDRVTAREMETYTMHDRTHGLKVAHLMWYILDPSVRAHLTPPEIGLLVCAAHLHDLGMGLNSEERDARLASSSDLWERLALDESTRSAIDALREQIGDAALSEAARNAATRRLFQAEEALLTQDTRARHATPERYREILEKMWQMHESDPEKIPDIKACLAFDGDSFRDKLIDICVSHNEDAEALVEADKKHTGRPRFPRDYPVGSSEADLHMVAATLRLADILDFDRERTPPALFYYLLPGPLSAPDNDSGREWGKHLAISNWHIEEDAIVFKGRCKSHIIHHAVVLFASAIEREIVGTRTTFGALQEVSWPFKLPSTVKIDIHEDGYRYVPYKFELDDDRVYSLLMGGAIYQNPLDAIRELVQNAVDACKLRDALTCMYDQSQPRTTERIFVRYEEPTADCKQPRLIVKDTGTGMDALIIERYFLKVGRSYYNSTEFNQTRVDLRKMNLDFAPVSEFGIGFLSSFLLANRVEVETAMWESHRSDTTKRALQIDGPTRLIRLSEERNEGPQRLKGTRITLYLLQGHKRDRTKPPEWEEIKEYLEDICQDLPYRLDLEHVADGKATRSFIDPVPLTIELPSHLEPFALRIPVDSKEAQLEGEIILINSYAEDKASRESGKAFLVSVTEQDDPLGLAKPRNHYDSSSALLRGGFKIGAVGGLAERSFGYGPRARLRLIWEETRSRRYVATNLARTGLSGSESISQDVQRLWLTYLIEHMDDLQEGLIRSLHIEEYLTEFIWLQQYDALKLYELAKQGWRTSLSERGMEAEQIKLWEQGDGDPLPLPDRLAKFILDFILPRVTSLAIDHRRMRYANPPRPDWRLILSSCHDYITVRTYWGMFAEYIKDIAGLLYFFPADYFNSHFQERLASIPQDKLALLRLTLMSIMASTKNNTRTELNAEQASLFRHLQDIAGELEIGLYEERWRVDSFKFQDVS